MNYETEFEDFKVQSSTEFENLGDADKVDFVKIENWADKYQNKEQQPSIPSLCSDRTLSFQPNPKRMWKTSTGSAYSSFNNLEELKYYMENENSLQIASFYP